MICLSTEELRGRGEGPFLVVLGNFDGVHRGHQALLAAAAEKKRETGLPVAVWTFEETGGRDRITPPPLRAGWLEAYGADAVIYDRFERVKNLSPEAFAEEILFGTVGARGCICGFNYRFGRERSGDPALLERLCRERGAFFHCVEEVTDLVDGESVSVCSTLIRELLRKGDLLGANRLLGHAFVTCGEVLHGRGIGHTVGMPTINQSPDPAGILLPRGVYATFCRAEGKLFASVTNVGLRPTVGETSEVGIETYIPGFRGDLYGKNIPVGYLGFLRGEKKFSSMEELSETVAENAREATEIFLALEEEPRLPALAGAPEKRKKEL